eukprot:COSAG06_NODE_1632_length_8855_cov_44.798310_10_plen_273_part_00
MRIALLPQLLLALPACIVAIPLLAQHSSKCSRCPHHSDVVATSRQAHYTKDHGYTTFGAIEAFHATRLDWVYSTNASFVKEVQAVPGVTAVTLAMNPQVPDPGGTFLIGRIQNIHGEPLDAPWMRAWPSKPYYGCINHPDYLKLAFARGIELFEMSGAIQHDDPTANGEAASWDQGDPESSGCYCEHCMAGFTKALEGLNESMRERLNVSAAFNYREVLLDNSSYAPAVLAELRELFVAFQVNSTERYIGKRNRPSFQMKSDHFAKTGSGQI